MSCSESSPYQNLSECDKRKIAENQRQTAHYASPADAPDKGCVGMQVAS